MEWVTDLDRPILCRVCRRPGSASPTRIMTIVTLRGVVQNALVDAAAKTSMLVQRSAADASDRKVRSVGHFMPLSHELLHLAPAAWIGRPARALLGGSTDGDDTIVALAQVGAGPLAPSRSRSSTPTPAGASSTHIRATRVSFDEEGATCTCEVVRDPRRATTFHADTDSGARYDVRLEFGGSLVQARRVHAGEPERCFIDTLPRVDSHPLFYVPASEWVGRRLVLSGQTTSPIRAVHTELDRAVA